MQLLTFQIFNFRSINDSGEIEIAKITSLLGRNESGKSNLLLGLRTLNPVEGYKALNPTKDFPRHRRLSECSDQTEAVTSMWELNTQEKGELAKIFPRASSVSKLKISRPYGATRDIVFEEIKSLSSYVTDTPKKIEAIASSLATIQPTGEHKQAWESAVIGFKEIKNIGEKLSEWAEACLPLIAALKKAIASSKVEISGETTREINSLEKLLTELAKDKEALKKAREWVKTKLPVFIFLDDYPELDGHQNIQQYLNRKDQGQLNVTCH